MNQTLKIGMTCCLLASTSITATKSRADGWVDFIPASVAAVTTSQPWIAAVSIGSKVAGYLAPTGFIQIAGVAKALDWFGDSYINFANKAFWPATKFAFLGVTAYGGYKGIQYATGSIVPTPYGAYPIMGGTSTRRIIFRGSEHNPYLLSPTSGGVQNPQLYPGQSFFPGLDQFPRAGQSISIFDGVLTARGADLANAQESYERLSADSKGRVGKIIGSLKDELAIKGLLSQYFLESDDTNVSVQTAKYIAAQAGFEEILVVSTHKLINMQYDLSTALTDLYNWANTGSEKKKRIIVLTDYNELASQNLARTHGLPERYVEGILKPFLAGLSSHYTILGVANGNRTILKDLPGKVKPVLLETTIN